MTAEKKSLDYQICSKTIMDTSDPDITFDDAGICNYFYEFQKRKQEEILEGAVGQKFLSGLSKEIKKETKRKKYDCIIGLSGGVDSSYVAYMCVEKLGLRPLAVHLDNGWNTELAVSNIENIVKTLNIDLVTEVLDWAEFKELQTALFRASVGNIEIATDHAINALLFKAASNFGLKYILTGSNLNTEGILQKGRWAHDNKDWVNIRDINKRHGRRRLRQYPNLSSLDFVYSIIVRGTRFIPILNYCDFNKDKAKKTLVDELGWRPYDRKHGESTFTRFFQEYYLPEKFNVDKRRSHLSSLICAQQMTREDALIEISKPLFEGEEKERLIEFVLKKLEMSSDEWDAIMSLPPKLHSDYKTSWVLSDRRSIFYKFGRRMATGRNKI